MQRRTLATGLEVSALGLGCMGMSEFYGPRDDAQSLRTLAAATEQGVDFLDTADTYGPHHNETLIGRFLATHPRRVRIASKFGIVRAAGDYRRRIDNSAQYARQSCEASLRRLGVEQIDLYYVHRIGPQQPIEATMLAWPIWSAKARSATSACARSAPPRCAVPMRSTRWRRCRPSTRYGRAGWKPRCCRRAVRWASAWWPTPRSAVAS